MYYLHFDHTVLVWRCSDNLELIKGQVEETTENQGTPYSVRNRDSGTATAVCDCDVRGVVAGGRGIDTV